VIAYDLRPALYVDDAGVRVRNHGPARSLAWDEIEAFALERQPGRRPPRAVIQPRDGESVPVTALTGTHVVTQGFKDGGGGRREPESPVELSVR
jgi:hypothetical protein